MALRSTGGISSIGDFLAAVQRHKLKVALFVVATLAGALAIIVWWPRSYSSEAMLFVRVGRQSVTLDPTATTGQTVSLLDSRETEINSVVEILLSRAIAEKVVDKLGPEVILNTDAKVSGAAPPAWLATAGALLQQLRGLLASVDPIDSRQRAIMTVAGSLLVSSPRDTSVINLTYTDEAPARAQQILATLLDEYSREHVRINRTAGSLQFFEDQSRLMSANWQQAAEELRRTKTELGLVSIAAQRKLLEEEMSRLHSQYAHASTAQKVNAARLTELQKLAQSTPARKITEQQDGFPNEALDAMRQSLYALEIRERELLAKYTDAHPEVIAIRDQVVQAREILGGQDERRTRMITSVNPAREKLDIDLHSAQAEASSLAAETQTLAGEIDKLLAKITALNQHEIRIAELEQQVELTHRNYLAHAEKLEQARIDQALEVDRISNVNVIQAASLEPRPSSPRKPLVAAAGLILALGGGLLIVLVSEHLNNSLRTPDDVEQVLELPVLAALPRQVGYRLATNPH